MLKSYFCVEKKIGNIYFKNSLFVCERTINISRFENNCDKGPNVLDMWNARRKLLLLMLVMMMMVSLAIIQFKVSKVHTHLFYAVWHDYYVHSVKVFFANKWIWNITTNTTHPPHNLLTLVTCYYLIKFKRRRSWPRYIFCCSWVMTLRPNRPSIN